jgi:hypothetical protein
MDRNNLFTISFHMLYIFNENAIFLRELSQDMLSTANSEQFDKLQICTTVTLHPVLSLSCRETPVGKVTSLRAP